MTKSNIYYYDIAPIGLYIFTHTDVHFLGVAWDSMSLTTQVMITFLYWVELY